MWVITIGPRLRRRLSAVLACAALVGVAWWGAGVTARDLAAAGSAGGPVRSVRTTERALALTFNVTWGSTEVGRILDVLQRNGSHATFFLPAAWARSNPDLLRRMVSTGQEVETMGNRQVDLARLPSAVVREDLQLGNTALVETTGQAPRYLRPPLGAYSAAVLREAHDLGLTTVLWDVDSHDWMKPGVDYIVNRVLQAAHPGAIVLLHAGDDMGQTAAALPALLDGLRNRGYRLLTVHELLALGR
jgi:peptidoglycan/xylan/chitin deacetylase (PgdA/CDA1 family)